MVNINKWLTNYVRSRGECVCVYAFANASSSMLPCIYTPIKWLALYSHLYYERCLHVLVDRQHKNGKMKNKDTVCCDLVINMRSCHCQTYRCVEFGIETTDVSLRSIVWSGYEYAGLWNCIRRSLCIVGGFFFCSCPIVDDIASH